MSNLFTHKHTNRNTLNSGVNLGGPIRLQLSDPALNNDIFDFIGTDRLARVYSEPCFGGAGWSGNFTDPASSRVKICVLTTSNFAFSSTGSWLSAGVRTTPSPTGYSSGKILREIYNFTSGLYVYTLGGKLQNDHCFARPSQLVLRNTLDANGVAINVQIRGSEDGKTWFTLGSVVRTSVFDGLGARWETIPLRSTKYLRFIDVNVGADLAPYVGGIKLFGEIKFLK